MYQSTYLSPIGRLDVFANEMGVTHIKYKEESTLYVPNGHTQLAVKQLEEYFSKKRTIFDVPLDMKGTDFEQNVWKYLVSIPYGHTTNYGTIAKKVSSIKAVRAVGAANGKNPIPIIVPCHRVIGSNGDLVGFALGLDVKRKLLSLENPDEFGEQLSLF